MTLKETLIAAHRYDDIMFLLKEISEKHDDYAYPLRRPLIDRLNHTLWSIDTKSIIEQAARLIIVIEDGCDGNTEDDFDKLSAYVNDKSDTLLHNYAVSVSHKIEPEYNIDTIRCWEILDNMLACWNNNYDEPWYIPDGWVA